MAADLHCHSPEHPVSLVTVLVTVVMAHGVRRLAGAARLVKGP